jgi:ABC-type oligopeptide transport system substrate-binding subunit
MSLKPNPHWAGDIKPTLDWLILRLINDDAAATSAFRTDDLDATVVAIDQLTGTRAMFEPLGQYMAAQGPTTWELAMRQERTPLDKAGVRLALSQAIDREALNDAVGGGLPTTTWLPESAGGPSPDAFQSEIGFNPEEARRNLADAGYPGGEGFPSLSILIFPDPSLQAAADFLRESFKDVLGIDVGVELTDDGTTYVERTEGDDWDMTISPSSAEYPDPESWLPPGGCGDPAVDHAIEAAQAAAAPEQRTAGYVTANELVVTTGCHVPLLQGLHHYLIKPYVIGMRENAGNFDSTLPGDLVPEAWGRAAPLEP